MSRSWVSVMSNGGITSCVRSGLSAGSMSWLRNAIESQWEIDEPGWTGLVAKSCGRPATSAPAARSNRAPA